MIKVDDSKLEGLNAGLNALTNLIAIIYTVSKHEESELGLEEYLNREFEQIHDLEIMEDEDGYTVRDDEGNPIFKDVFIPTEEEKNRDLLKKILTNIGATSSQELIDIFNKDTKSNVSNKYEAQELVLYHRKVLEPIVQMGRLYDNLKELGASKETLEDITNIYNREMEKLEKFLLL